MYFSWDMKNEYAATPTMTANLDGNPLHEYLRTNGKLEKTTVNGKEVARETSKVVFLGVHFELLPLICKQLQYD